MILIKTSKQILHVAICKICKEKYKRVGQPGSIFSSWKREKRNIEEDEKEGNPAPEKRQKMTKVDPNLVE